MDSLTGGMKQGGRITKKEGNEIIPAEFIEACTRFSYRQG
jgi:hypothetical protein